MKSAKRCCKKIQGVFFSWKKAVAFIGAQKTGFAGVPAACGPNKSNLVRVGVPSKGRLFEPSVSLLRDAGFAFCAEGAERKLSLTCANFPLELFFVRAEDVPSLVESGAFDFGITGFDLLLEKGAAGVESVLDLGFGECRLALALPAESGFSKASDLDGARVATSFPGLVKSFFAKRSVGVQVVELKGAVENACRLGAADAVVDLVASGSTLQANGLRVLENVLEYSSARLVARRGGTGFGGFSELQSEFVEALQSVVQGRFKKLVTANAPEGCLGEIRGVLPALCSPTVSRLFDGGMVSVQAVVEEGELQPVLKGLKKCGASGIIVSSVERLVL